MLAWSSFSSSCNARSCSNEAVSSKLTWQCTSRLILRVSSWLLFSPAISQFLNCSTGEKMSSFERWPTPSLARMLAPFSLGSSISLQQRAQKACSCSCFWLWLLGFLECERSISLESARTWLRRVVMWEELAWLRAERNVLEIAQLRLFSVARREESLLWRACARESFSLYFCALPESEPSPPRLEFLLHSASSLLSSWLISPMSSVFSFSSCLFTVPMRDRSSARPPACLPLTFLMIRATSSSMLECSPPHARCPIAVSSSREGLASRPCSRRSTKRRSELVGCWLPKVYTLSKMSCREGEAELRSLHREYWLACSSSSSSNSPPCSSSPSSPCSSSSCSSSL